MQLVKRTAEYTIYKKRSGRHAVQNAQSVYVNGDEKQKILLAAGLIKFAAPKPKEEPAAEEHAAA